jgi:hypothetical protein
MGRDFERRNQSEMPNSTSIPFYTNVHIKSDNISKLRPLMEVSLIWYER